ncbi:MAG: MMPL family transporter [Actinomycetota bacterium]|nr:MAG: MMPL family transporter [Actinomycetota bacterium]
MNRLFAKVGHYSVRFRWFIVLVWIIGSFATIKFLPSISSVIKTNNQAFLPSNSPSITSAKLAKPLQNYNYSLIVMVGTESSGTLTPTDLKAFSAINSKVSSVPTVLSVKISGISSDDKAVQAEIISSTSAFDDTKITTVVSNIRSAMTSISTPSGFSVHLAGQTATAVDSVSKNGSQSSNTQNFSVLIIFVILALVFRAVLAPIITLLPALLVAIVAGPLVAEASHLGFQVSFITQLLLIVLVLGAGTDYGLFLVFRVREELKKGSAPKEAVTRALSKVGESITFSAATVIAALLSLATAHFGLYRGLGYPLAIGISLMLLAGLTLLPALLAILGKAVFWPSNVKVGTYKIGTWGRLASTIVKRPLITLLVGMIFFGSLAIISVGNHPSGFSSATTSPKGTDSYFGNQNLKAHFPSSTFNPTQVIYTFDKPVWTNLTQLNNIETALSQSPHFKTVSGPFNTSGTQLTPDQLSKLHSQLGDPRLLPAEQSPTAPGSANSISAILYNSYRSEYQYISADGKTVIFETTLTAGDASSTSALNAVPAIRAQVAEIGKHYGTSANGVAGEAPASYDISAASNSDLLRIVPIVVIIIGILLAIVLRSSIAPLYLVVSVVLSYLAALGLDVLVFVHILGHKGLSFVLPFLLFLFLLALGEDYNILVMTRIREEAHHMNLKDAVTAALSATGSTVTSAGLVLAGTFLVLGISSGGNAQVQEIGFGLALGILMDTFLVRTLLVPSIVVLLGKYNWWPSKLVQTQEELTAEILDERKELMLD